MVEKIENAVVLYNVMSQQIRGDETLLLNRENEKLIQMKRKIGDRREEKRARKLIPSIPTRLVALRSFNPVADLSL